MSQHLVLYILVRMKWELLTSTKGMPLYSLIFCLAIISFQKRMKCQTIESKKTVNISLKHLRVIQAYGSCPQTLPTMGIQAYWKKYQIRCVCYNAPAHNNTFHTASISVYTWERVLRSCFLVNFRPRKYCKRHNLWNSISCLPMQGLIIW